jgi:hypothetical protein
MKAKANRLASRPDFADKKNVRNVVVVTVREIAK